MDIFNDADMVDPDGQELSVKEFARRERADFSPTLLFYGKDGKRILRITGYQSPERFKKILGYVTGQHYRSESLGEYLNHLPISKAAHAGIRPKYKRSLVLSRNLLPTSKPLLLIFEKTGCGECDDFRNNVLRLKRVKNTLKQFEVVSLDAMDDKTDIITPDGIRTTASSLFRNYAFSRMPAIAFFDVNGNPVLKTDALVLPQRMMNSLNFVLEKAYKKGMTYQKFARTKAIESIQKKQNIKQ
jgi:thioredoxin-related protein